MDIQILIVDDEEDIRNSIYEYMRRSGFIAFVAADAESAIDILEITPIDVVITDILLPNMNGLELTHSVTEQFNSDVIVMTGYGAEYSYEEAIGKGASDFIFKPIRLVELLLRLKRVLNERQLKQNNILMLNELKELAITDPLTGLFNIRYFKAQLKQEIDRALRYNHSISLMMMDIDYFKEFNDRYGHPDGDKGLILFSEIILGCLRKIDIACRYGGDEFTVMLPETGWPEAKLVAERIRESVEKNALNPLPGQNVFRTISIGIAEYTSKESIDDIIQRADKALYESKSSGRNRVTYLAAD